jgi:putative restriction endonuclease
MARAPSVKWTRDHSLIALNLYHKLSFGQLDSSNKRIKEVAQKMGRSANSLAMKLSNFASLDPVLQARGIKGLDGASNQDKEMWTAFHGDLATWAPESERLMHDLFTGDDGLEVDFLAGDQVALAPERGSDAPKGPTEVAATVKVRRGQQFFRQTVLAAYGVSCCISGIAVPRLLIASHIKPWGKFPGSRLDPQNGLCLSSLHDAAFDAGLITLDKGYNVVLSKRLRQYMPHPALELNFSKFEGKPIRMPEKSAFPSPDFLSYHREEVFAG